MRRVVVFLFLLVFPGCSHHVTVERPAQLIAVPREMPSDQAPIGFVDAIDVKRDRGISVNPSMGFKEKVVRTLSETNMFSHVVTNYPVGKTDVVTLRFSAQEDLDTNDGSNVTKAAFIGFTLFLLMPVLPLSYDYNLKLSLEALCADGQSRQYAAEGVGSASTTGFGQVQPAIVELSGAVIDRTLSEIVANLSRDRAFFLACSSRNPREAAAH